MNLLLKSKEKYVSCTHKLSKKVLFLSTLVLIFDTIFMANDPWIDKEHFEKYPYCGRMAIKNPSKAATKRIVNSFASTEYYRWVVRITRKNLKINGKMISSTCSGTVITERLEYKLAVNRNKII